MGFKEDETFESERGLTQQEIGKIKAAGFKLTDIAGLLQSGFSFDEAMRLAKMDQFAWVPHVIEETGEYTTPKIGKARLEFGLVDVKPHSHTNDIARWKRRVRQAVRTIRRRQ